MSKITININKSEIAYLLGAIELSLLMEDCCKCLSLSSLRGACILPKDWGIKVQQIKDSIKQQAGEDHEDRGFGISETCLDQIREWTLKQCEKNTENYDIWKSQEDKRKKLIIELHKLKK